MDKLVIHGGHALQGEVQVSGAKNAALPEMAAALLAVGEHRLRRVPRLADIATLGKLLGYMGVEVERGRGRAAEELRLRTPQELLPEAPYEMVKTMRASVLVLGPLVARIGHARVSLPGGCAIGARPIDHVFSHGVSHGHGAFARTPAFRTCLPAHSKKWFSLCEFQR